MAASGWPLRLGMRWGNWVVKDAVGLGMPEGGFAERLAKLRREAAREWKRRSKQRKRQKREPRDWRLLGVELLQGLLRLVAVVVLPFVVLVRGAVFFYEHGNVPSWLALSVSALLTIGLVTLYAASLLRRFTGRPPVLLLAKWVALPLVVSYCGFSLLYLSRVNAKPEVRDYYGSVHPLLRLALSTWILVDDKLVVTDMCRERAVRPLVLPLARHAAHQAERGAHRGGSERHAPHAQRFQRREGRRVGSAEDVERRVDFLDEPLDRFGVADERNEDAIGAGLTIRVAAAHRLRELAVGRQRAAVEGVGAGVEHERDPHPRRRCRLARGPDARHREVEVEEALVDRVLEVHPHRAGREHAAHGFGDGVGRAPEARLHVRGHRDRHALRNARDRGEHLAAADPFTIRVAQAKGDARARRGERREAGLHEDAGGARVPGVGEHEQRTVRVEFRECDGFVATRLHRG